jgi:hypothetical protein
MHHETYDQAVFMIHALELQVVKTMRADLLQRWESTLNLYDQISNIWTYNGKSPVLA